MKTISIVGSHPALSRTNRAASAPLSKAVTPKAVLSMALLALMGLTNPSARANPAGMTVVRGTAQATQNGSQLSLNVSQNAFLNWNSFNIRAGESTIFHQPSSDSIVWNNIGGASASQIYGSMQANGLVILANPNGIYFGPNAYVKVGGLFVTTAPITSSMCAGGVFDFSGPPPGIPIINYGHLETANGGSLFLIAHQIENHGILSAPGGTVGLTAGQEVLLSSRPDGRGLSARVTLPAGVVNNQGQIVADAGHVLMQAQTVNQGGLVSANSAREHNGVIELFAADKIELGAQSIIEARGGQEGVSSGGQITIKSENQFVDHPGSLITAPGGSTGGNGGQIEISAPRMPSLFSHVDAQAAAGSVSGRLVLDPDFIVLSSSGSGTTSGGVVNSGDETGTLNLNVGDFSGIGSIFNGFSTIMLQAKKDITLSSAWDLPTSTGKDEVGCQLTLEAGRDLNLNANLTGGGNWSFSLKAGLNFDPALGQVGIVLAGVGNVNLTGSAVLQAGLGAINVLAGNNVTVGAGAIRTMGGGSIAVAAEAGTVNCGNNVNGYNFTPGTGSFVVSPDLGGISTAAGGDVSITAGKDVIAYGKRYSISPAEATQDAGAGAFGAAPGNVTIVAGRNVTGHYMERNGVGLIQAGANAGSGNTDADRFSLSLTKGSWSVTAGNSIVLQEVRNPNGVFNFDSRRDRPNRFLFDYDPAASVSLHAGNSVELTGNQVPRRNPNSGAVQISALPDPTLAPVVYPPILGIQAGSGGVKIDSDVVLFPSPIGNLTIATSDGGNLYCPNNVKLTLSAAPTIATDSSKVRWSFGSDAFTALEQWNVLLHKDDFDPDEITNPDKITNPARITIDGSINPRGPDGTTESFSLLSCKPVEITAVKGDIYNTAVKVINLKAKDKSAIAAGGTISWPNNYNYITLPASTLSARSLFYLLNLGILLHDMYPNADAQTALGLIQYVPSDGHLYFVGQMTDRERDALKNLKLKNPAFPDREDLATPLQLLDSEKIDGLYAATTGAGSGNDSGFLVWGPGTLDVHAKTIDLGYSKGIESLGIGGYPESPIPGLRASTPRGAKLEVTASDHLAMLSSRILSEYGGAIEVNSGGSIDIGSQDPVGETGAARGIVSLGGGNIDVLAQGNIEVNGSRIAAYDGGNVHVESFTGDVDAGAGGSGAITLYKPFWNAAEGEISVAAVTIPGSGILATSFPDSPGLPPSLVGNILVETPRGDILAGQGGIVQLSFGSVDNASATLSLRAGSTDPDGTVHRGSILVGSSGVLGKQVDLKATGDIVGLVVAQGNLDISSKQNVNVVAIGQGAVSVNASGTVGGTLIGAGGVTVGGGGTFNANVISAPGAASINGNTASTASNTGTAAPTASTASQSTTKEAESTVASNDTAGSGDEKKKKNLPSLVKRVGRVTVILPPNS